MKATLTIAILLCASGAARAQALPGLAPTTIERTCSTDANLAPAAPDPTGILGYPGSLTFGAWAAAFRIPHLAIEVGVDTERFTSLMARNATITGGAIAAIVPTPTPIDTAAMLVARGTIDLHRAWYVGSEVGIGGVVGERETLTTAAGVTLPGQSLAIEVLGLVGVRTRVGRGSLGFEVAGGLRAVNYDFLNGPSLRDEQQVEGSGAVVQARVRADWWLNPWLTVGATVGVSALDRDEWMTGLTFGVHTRAFGGLR